jgi:hypothetical protein
MGFAHWLKVSEERQLDQVLFTRLKLSHGLRRHHNSRSSASKRKQAVSNGRNECRDENRTGMMSRTVKRVDVDGQNGD